MSGQIWNKPFDTLMVIRKDFLEKGYFEEDKNEQTTKRMKKYPACKWLNSRTVMQTSDYVWEIEHLRFVCGTMERAELPLHWSVIH